MSLTGGVPGRDRKSQIIFLASYNCQFRNTNFEEQKSMQYVRLVIFALILVLFSDSSAADSGKSIYPDNVEDILYQRDLHGATQAYLWGQSLSTSYAFMDGNLRAADYMDFITYITPLEKRFIITSNLATPYMISTVNLGHSDGLVVLTVPSGPSGGIINDLQMRNISDTGLAGPDRGQGGTYLIVGPGAQVPDDHNADYVIYSKTNKIWIGTRLLSTDPEENNRMRDESRIAAYGKPSTTKVVSIGDTEYRGWARFGIDYWRDLHEMIQDEPMGPEDAMALEFLKRIGIEKGKPFEPNQRQLKIMEEAEKLGYTQSVATSAGRIYDAQLSQSRYYPDKNWSKILNLTSIDTHINPETGVMDLDSRTSYAHEAVSMSKGMTEDVVGVGSKYIAAYKDSDQNWLNGSHTYQLVVNKDVPAEQFWSVIAYRADTRTFVINQDMKPGITSRDALVPNPDGSVTITFSRACKSIDNCIETAKGQDFFVYFRVYAPKEAWFDKSWQLDEIEKLN
jgi:hypothetical protein